MRLRSLLLRWLLVPTLALWALGFAAGYARSLAQAHEAHDRTLLGSALVIAERLTISDGEVVADLPRAALEMLRSDAQDRIYYRVAELADGRYITGYEDLPPPPQPPPGADAVFYDARYKNEDIRVAALAYTVLDGTRTRRLLVQVAETLQARRLLTRQIVADASVVQLLLIVAAAAFIALGVERGLAPLKRLRDEVRGRGANDLTPIDTRAVVREVAPLIHAINAHTARQRQLSEAQVRFVSNASHQLKTPLTALRAQVDHALQQNDVEAMRAVVMRMHASTETTRRLVTQLLSLARSESGGTLEVEEADLTELAREVAFEMIGLARDKRIDLGFEGEEPVMIRGERVLLRELVANLVHNAVSYTPPGGKVTVQVTRRDGRPALAVIDSGPGIPVEERQKVLERFYRGSAGGANGSGLGLAIVKEICDRHQMDLSMAEGIGGAGLCVLVAWPIAP